MGSRRWAVGQLNSGDDLERNLETALRYLVEAAKAGCELISFPEVFLFRGGEEASREHGLTLDSEPVQRLRQAARDHSIYVQAGSILTPPPGETDPERLHNTAPMIGPDGTILDAYHKVHLFDVELPDFSVRESDLMEPGDELSNTSVNGVTCGLSVCYDLRFPELYRELSREGAQVLFVPSNFTRETGRAHWEPLLRARAIENQCYVIAPNQIGENPHTGVASLGQSMVVDPWGQVVARMSDYEGWMSAQLDLDYLEDCRQQLPALKHRELSCHPG